jgi:heme/copper-type cytochrome/quinol oxidase subunit 2
MGSAADVSLHSVLAPAGPQATLIHQLWLVMALTSTVVLVVVLGFVGFALLKGSRQGRDRARPVTSEASLSRGVAFAVTATALILLGLLAVSLWIGRATASLHAERIGSWIAAAERALGIDGRPVRIGVEHVTDVGRRVAIALTVSDTTADVVERRVREYISRIPGA